MNTKLTLMILARIEEHLDAAKSISQAQGKIAFWQRDKAFLVEAKNCLLSNERERVQWLYNHLGNLSQGFGRYCADLRSLDSLLDELYGELESLLLERD